MSGLADCKFGFVEYDGARYCHEHQSIQEVWHEIRSHCPRYVAEAAERRRASQIEED